MKVLIFTVANIFTFHSAVANNLEPFLVHAVVRELKHDSSSPPMMANRSLAALQFEKPSW